MKVDTVQCYCDKGSWHSLGKTAETPLSHIGKSCWRSSPENNWCIGGKCSGAGHWQSFNPLRVGINAVQIAKWKISIVKDSLYPINLKYTVSSSDATVVLDGHVPWEVVNADSELSWFKDRNFGDSRCEWKFRGWDMAPPIVVPWVQPGD